MTTATIFELDPEGHRAAYAAILARELLSLGIHVRVLGPSDLLSRDEGKFAFENLIGQIEFVGVPLDSPPDARLKFSVLADHVRSHVTDRIYVPYADGLAQTWGATAFPSRSEIARTPTEGLLMRGAFAYLSPNKLKAWKASLSAHLVGRSQWTLLHHLDPIAVKQMENWRSCSFKQVEVMPEAMAEPFEIERDLACNELGIPHSLFTITCPGQISERKGCNHLIEAFDSIDSNDCQLVLFGKTSPLVERLLCGKYSNLVRNKKIVWRNKFISDREFNLLFAASNLVCLPYPRHIGSASILIKAAQYQKQTLCSDWGWMGWAANEFSLGKTCNVLDREHFRWCLRSFIESETSTLDTLNRNAVEKRMGFLRFHTLDNHLAHWTESICDAEGISQEKKATRWKTIRPKHG
ncbi:MAG: hypothetical protein ACE361_09640 [Aureliella sp.]